MSNDLKSVDGLVRIENVPKSEMQNQCMEMTHAVYPHSKIYGDFCPIQTYIDCPPEKAFEYLSGTESLLEWTYSLRDMKPTDEDGLYEFVDAIGGETKCYCKTISHKEAMTVDYHCSWDQGKELWMIYLMRVIPAELVLNKPGCVVTWINCKHPYYDENPFPEAAPENRKVWVGDGWSMFYAGHTIELMNLKAILEHRYGSKR